MFAILILLIVSIPVALLRGLVLSDLVGWFTPYSITVVQGIGLAIIVGLFTSHLKTSAQQEPGQSFKEFSVFVLLQQIMLILLAWAFGWVWHFFL